MIVSGSAAHEQRRWIGHWTFGWCVVVALTVVGCANATPAPIAEALPTYSAVTPSLTPTDTLTPTPSPTPTPIPSPTPDVRNPEQLCFDLDRYWSRDWVNVILALERLRDLEAACGEKLPTQMLYPAYYNYAVALQARGRLPQAIEYYRKAQAINPDGREVTDALKRLNMFTPIAMAACTPDRVKTALESIPLYRPVKKSGFARLRETKFEIDGAVFRVRGVNYYPMRAPWRRFLTDTDLVVAARELDLIQAAGLNTIRIFLWYPALFDCPGSGLVPRAEAFARLDGILALAAARDLHVLVTLNDLPDLSIRPLYTNPTIAAAHTAYIVDRYRAEPAILAWDLRNEGDIDITREQQSPAAVYRWLEETSKLVRATDPNHLITAGWLSNPISTDPAVDFFSFHHWTEATAIFDRVRALRALSTKPVLLEEVGYSTFGGDLERQSRDLLAAVQAADQAGMLGWIVWTAFDFPTDVTCIQPACPSKDNGEHHFGLWRVGYSAKPAVEALLRYTATNK